MAEFKIFQRGLDWIGDSRKHCNMLKMGDRRDDGYVFTGYSKHKNGRTYEQWTSLDKFLMQRGDDFFERRNARLKRQKAKHESRKKWHAHMAYLATLTDTQRADRDRLAYKEYKEKRKKLDPDYHKRIYAKMLLDPVRLEKHRAKQARSRKRYNEKQKAINAEKRAKRKAEQEALQKIKQEQAEARRIEKAKIAAEKALAKSLRPKRIALTEEQRKEKRKLEKRNYKHVRRARINNCEVKATPKMVEDSRKLAGDRCYYCGKKAELTLDHFEPLAKGGAHCLSNFVFACHPCNSRKRDLDPFEFIAANVPAGFHD